MHVCMNFIKSMPPSEINKQTLHTNLDRLITMTPVQLMLYHPTNTFWGYHIHMHKYKNIPLPRATEIGMNSNELSLPFPLFTHPSGAISNSPEDAYHTGTAHYSICFHLINHMWIMIEYEFIRRCETDKDPCRGNNWIRPTQCITIDYSPVG